VTAWSLGRSRRIPDQVGRVCGVGGMPPTAAPAYYAAAVSQRCEQGLCPIIAGGESASDVDTPGG